MPSDTTNLVLRSLFSGLVAALITLATVLIYAGGLISRVEQNEKRTEKLENSLTNIQQNMVTKDDLREVRIDLKELTRQLVVNDIKRSNKK